MFGICIWRRGVHFFPNRQDSAGELVKIYSENRLLPIEQAGMSCIGGRKDWIVIAQRAVVGLERMGLFSGSDGKRNPQGLDSLGNWL